MWKLSNYVNLKYDVQLNNAQVTINVDNHLILPVNVKNVVHPDMR